MNISIVEQIHNRTVFLIANKKNAGKTTFLNFALSQVRGNTPIAFMTIGVDGEANDTVDNSIKPFIYTERGDYIITTSTRLNQSDASFAIEQVFPFQTALGRLVLAHTVRRGRVELVGSEDNRQLSEIIRFLKDEKKIQTILIDGAVNRATQVAVVENSYFYYILRVDQQTMDTDFNKLRTISYIHSFPCIEKLKEINKQEVYEIQGAFTESMIQSIPLNCKVILINDFTRIFLNISLIERLCSKYQIAYKSVYTLLSIVVILKNVKRQDFEMFIHKNNIKDPIIMNPYEN